MILGATLKLTEISVVRGLQLLLLVILIAAFQWGGILYIALAVSACKCVGLRSRFQVGFKTAVQPLLERRRTLHCRSRSVGSVSLIVGLVLQPALSSALPVAIGMETPLFRLIIFGVFIFIACISIEYPFHRELFRERFAEVASKFSLIPQLDTPSGMSTRLSDYDYPLPEDLIAKYPPAHRGDSRLLVIHRGSQTWEDRTFADFVEYLKPGDVLVVNKTKVIPARLMGKRATNGSEY